MLGPSVSESNSVKLSGRSDMAKFEWIGMGLLAMTTADYGVRIWDLIQNSNYMLELSSFNLVQDDVATCVAYNPIKSLLAAGTNNQKIVLWKYVYGGSEPQGNVEYGLVYLCTGDFLVKMDSSNLCFDKLFCGTRTKFIKPERVIQ